MREMHELEKTIGYEFKNEGYLRTALTHSSYANEMRSRCPYNERQEFLGDAVLSIIVSDYLFKSSHLAEGDLTKLRASIVCEKSLWAGPRRSTSAIISCWERARRTPADGNAPPSRPMPLRHSSPPSIWTAAWSAPGNS